MEIWNEDLYRISGSFLCRWVNIPINNHYQLNYSRDFFVLLANSAGWSFEDSNVYNDYKMGGKIRSTT